MSVTAILRRDGLGNDQREQDNNKKDFQDVFTIWHDILPIKTMYSKTNRIYRM
jgi:hypothetical protein